MITKLEYLSYDEKIEELAYFLNNYIDTCISKYTNNKEIIENVIEDKTLMTLIYNYNEQKRSRVRNIIKALKTPFNMEFNNYDNSAEISHILYELIIKDNKE